MGSLFGFGKAKGPSLAQKTAEGMAKVNEANAQNAATTANAQKEALTRASSATMASLVKGDSLKDDEQKKQNASGGFFGAGRGTFLGGGGDGGGLLG